MDINRITVLVLDVDGVLTAGDVTIDDRSSRSMSFDIQDGCALKLWIRAGYRIGLVSGRRSTMVAERAAELGIEAVEQGVENKTTVWRAMLDRFQARPDACCYVGDDLPDLGPVRESGFGVAVANSVPTLKRYADFVTRRRGGAGAVAETIELILRKQKRWSSLVLNG